MAQGHGLSFWTAFDLVASTALANYRFPPQFFYLFAHGPGESQNKRYSSVLSCGFFVVSVLPWSFVQSNLRSHQEGTKNTPTLVYRTCL